MSQNDDIRRRLQAHLNQTPLPPLEATRHFLQTYCYDAMTLDEVHALLLRRAQVNTRPLEVGLQAIEAILNQPQPDGTLAELVAEFGNVMLEDPSDIGARTWLEAVAAILRSAIASVPDDPV